MKRIKIIVSLIIIFSVYSQSLQAFFITDVLAYAKMVIELTKQTKSLKKIIKDSQSLNEEFKYFKNRYLRIHKGLTLNEMKLLFSAEALEFYYKSPYILINKDKSWKDIWKKAENLYKKYKYLKNNDHIIKDELYKKDKEYSNRVDYRLKNKNDIYKNYETVLQMLSDTKKVIAERKGRYKNIEKLIKITNDQGATGKLLAIQNELKIEQIIKLDLLITAIRVRMESNIKEKVILINQSKKNEIEQYKDQLKDAKAMSSILGENK